VAFLYMRPDETMTLFGSVSGGAATGYTDDALVDGKPGVPAKTGTSTPPWVITGLASSEVSLIAAHNHTLDASKTIAITGGVTANLTAPAIPANGIRLNPWVEVSPVTTNTLTVTISSNSVAILIGEILAGKVRRSTFNLQQRGAGFGIATPAELPAGLNSGLAGYEEGVEARSLVGIWRANDTDYALLLDWFRSTRGGTRPSVIIPDSAVNDAWVVRFARFEAQPISYRHWHIAVTFVEYPRTRW
jgi:hypothetical protein